MVSCISQKGDVCWPIYLGFFRVDSHKEGGRCSFLCACLSEIQALQPVAARRDDNRKLGTRGCDRGAARQQVWAWSSSSGLRNTAKTWGAEGLEPSLLPSKPVKDWLCWAGTRNLLRRLFCRDPVHRRKVACNLFPVLFPGHLNFLCFRWLIILVCYNKSWGLLLFKSCSVFSKEFTTLEGWHGSTSELWLILGCSDILPRRILNSSPLLADSREDGVGAGNLVWLMDSGVRKRVR